MVKHGSPKCTKSMLYLISVLCVCFIFYHYNRKDRTTDLLAPPAMKHNAGINTNMRRIYTATNNSNKEMANNQETLKRVKGPPHVIIFTIRRSGSTFLSEIFNQNDDYMYFFEPMRSLQLIKERATDPFSVPEAKSYTNQLLHAMFHCNFTMKPPSTHLPDLCFHLGSLETIRSLSTYCNSKKLQNGGYDAQYLSSTCRRYGGVAVKLIRIADINVFRDLFMDPTINVKLIHLVRDPRGMINSRYKALRNYEEMKAKHTGSPMSPEPIRPNEIEEICRHMERNVQYQLNTPDWLQRRYKLVRYEDLALNPLSVTQDIYNFLEMPLPFRVSHWLDVNTQQSNDGRNKLTSRNSSETAVQWKTELGRDVIDDIQAKCSSILNTLGYNIV